jgi:DNA polymerase-2
MKETETRERSGRQQETLARTVKMGYHEDMNETEAERGFILQAFQERNAGRRLESAVYLSGVLESGGSFAVVLTGRRPVLYLRRSDLQAAEPIIDAHGAVPTDSRFTTMDREPVNEVAAAHEGARAGLRSALHETGIRTYEADLSPVRRLLMELGVHCAVSIEGEWKPGRNVGRVYIDPELRQAEWNGSFRVLSLDIETDIRTGSVLAVSLACDGCGPDGRAIGLRHREVLLFREDQTERLSERDGVTYRYVSSEETLLAAFVSRVSELDPDIMTGWNIDEFDLPILERRCRAYRIPFLLGRSDRESTFETEDRQDERGGRNRNGGRRETTYPVIGRQVLDGLRLARIALKGMDDYRLETVAREVTGRTKLITDKPGAGRAEEILRLYREDLDALGRYCLTDAELVLEILEKKRLLDLTIRKSLLIGLTPEMVWRSVASFEFLYIEELHRRGYVAPTRGVDQEPLEAAPGGGIITPTPGVFENVLVLDFKSLYPSVMRTFNIDPLSNRLAESGADAAGAAGAEPITAPNGTRFSREPGILPAILDRFTERRDQAKLERDEVASYAYKIVMNSFYGVLGTEGCRFATTKLAGAITGFGRKILFWTRDYLESRGYRVLYGDTDSVFVLSGLDRTVPAHEAIGLGERLAAEINRALAESVRREYGVESKLEIEFDKFFGKFFLPAVRTQGADRETRGRAKGYAGLLLEADGRERLTITGMEAVRHDWTELAREFQRQLLDLAFHDTPVSRIMAYIRETISQVKSGRLDEKLVYRKSLRKPVASYTKALPPHVRAAGLLPPDERQGTIEYLQTADGPQPAGNVTSRIYYDHYVEKQLRPIAFSLASALGIELGSAFGSDNQLELF